MIKISKVIEKLQIFMEKNGDISITGSTPCENIGTRLEIKRAFLIREKDGSIQMVSDSSFVFDDETSEPVCDFIFEET